MTLFATHGLMPLHDPEPTRRLRDQTRAFREQVAAWPGRNRDAILATLDAALADQDAALADPHWMIVPLGRPA